MGAHSIHNGAARPLQRKDYIGISEVQWMERDEHSFSAFSGENRAVYALIQPNSHLTGAQSALARDAKHDQDSATETRDWLYARAASDVPGSRLTLKHRDRAGCVKARVARGFWERRLARHGALYGYRAPYKENDAAPPNKDADSVYSDEFTLLYTMRADTSKIQRKSTPLSSRICERDKRIIFGA